MATSKAFQSLGVPVGLESDSIRTVFTTQSSQKDKVRQQAEQGPRASWRNSGTESSEGNDGRPPRRGLASGMLGKQGSPVLWRFSSAGRHRLVAASRRLSRY